MLAWLQPGQCPEVNIGCPIFTLAKAHQLYVLVLQPDLAVMLWQEQHMYRVVHFTNICFLHSLGKQNVTIECPNRSAWPMRA